MSQIPTPDTMTWRRDGYRILLNEDGVMLHVPANRTFEQGEVRALIGLYNEIAGAVEHGDTFDAPHPPTPDEIRAMSHDSREKYAARRAMRAIEAEFTDVLNNSDVPF